MNNKEKESSDVLKAVTTDRATSNIKGNSNLHVSEEYVRGLYDNPSKLGRYKQETFASGAVKDPLTGEPLEQHIADAKMKYGEDWVDHVAETDHSTPLKTVYNKNRNRPFLSDNDIRQAANIEANYSIKSKATNSSKQDMTNSEMLRRQSEEGKIVDRDAARRLRREEYRSNQAVQAGIAQRQVMNMGEEALAGAVDAVEASTIPLALNIIFNIVQVYEKKKDTKTAVSDVSKSIGMVAATGSATRLLWTALQGVENDVLQFVLDNNLPAHLISMVCMIKDDIKGIKDKTISKEEGTSRILSKFTGWVAGRSAAQVLSQLLITANISSGIASGAATGGATVVAMYVTTVAKNLFDEVVGKGAWEAIKNSNIDCYRMATVMKESVEGIKYNTMVFSHVVAQNVQLNDEINSNLDLFEKRKHNI